MCNSQSVHRSMQLVECALDHKRNSWSVLKIEFGTNSFLVGVCVAGLSKNKITSEYHMTVRPGGSVGRTPAL